MKFIPATISAALARRMSRAARLHGWALVALGLWLAAADAHAQLPIPRLKAVFPCGARQGTSVDVALEGEDLDEASRLYFSHAGITAEKLPDEAGKPTRFKVAVAAGAPIGSHDVRFVGKFGISNARTFVVGTQNEAIEQEPNNQRPQATRVELGTVVNGLVDPGEDVDWFVFAAKAGQRVLVELWGRRIDSRVDGFLWLYDASGRELAASQDESTRDEKSDPLIDIVIPADGDYAVKLSDFVFNGSKECFYRLSIGTAPTIDFVLPTGAKPGEAAALTLFGRNLPGGEKTDLLLDGHALEKLTQSVVLPAEAAGALVTGEVVRAPASRVNGGEARIVQPEGTSNGKLVVASQLPELVEQEPNNVPEQAQRLPGPCAVSGQFNPAKDADCFVIAGKKDEAYTIEVFAQRIGSPADPNLEVLRPGGQVMAEAQDDGDNIGQIRFPTFTRDLRFDLKIPEDGDYTLRLEHLYGQRQGGLQFVYRMEVNRAQGGDFQLICQPPHENRLDSHVIRQGGRDRLDILVWQLNQHNAPITVTARNLPAGVSCDPIVIAPFMKWGTLVLSAAADAPLGEGEIEIVGTTEVNGVKVERKARSGVMVWDTGNTSAPARVGKSVVMAVRESAPFCLTASSATATLKLGEPLALKIAVARRPEAAVPVQLTGAGYQLPAGMEIPLTQVAAAQNEVALTLSTEKMQPGTYSFIVSGEAQVPFEFRPNDKRTLRCVYPSNAITFTLLPKDAKP